MTIPLIINPVRIIVSVALAAAVGFGAGWLVNGWRKDAELLTIKAAQKQAALTFEANARIREKELSRQLQEAKDAATKREIELRGAADRARRSADGLRDDLDELRRQLPGLAADACRQRADTLSELFGQCAADYRSMAETADRLASDRQTLMEAWPK